MDLHHFSSFSPDIKYRLLHWANKFETVCYLDSNVEKDQLLFPYYRYEAIIAAGIHEQISPVVNCFDTLKEFQARNNSWLLGFLSYDLKNETEDLRSENYDGIGMPFMHFFVPKVLFLLEKDVLTVIVYDQKIEREALQVVNREHRPDSYRVQNAESKISPRISKKVYLQTVSELQSRIFVGDIYEANFCQEFFAEEKLTDPLATYLRLNKISLAPFSCYYKLDDRYLLCSSPERFIKKTGNRIISQPIKGTMRRGRSNAEDERLKKKLQLSEKDRSENVMIVDLVRNDLSRTAKKNSVKVEELCGIYSFPTVHQMVSTVSSELRSEVPLTNVIKNAFPMGSMTGAPKVRAMELLEQYESTRRGLFSGTVGYITPEGDFDFNVVIRSILYNDTSHYISIMAGGAITAESVPENEYEECILKMKAMFAALGR